MFKTNWLAAALMLAGCCTASAQTAPEKAPPPVADKGTTVQAACLDEHDDYQLRGKHPMFVIELTNKCETRMICKVYAYVISAHGTAQGHGTIRLAAAAPGQPSKGTFTMKAKAMRGSSHSDRECRAL